MRRGTNPEPEALSARESVPGPQNLGAPALAGLRELVAALGRRQAQESRVHTALVVLVLRLVFLLMAEERRPRALPEESLRALRAELAQLAERDPELRGSPARAWPRLRSLFRALGARGAALFLPEMAPFLDEEAFTLEDRTLLAVLEPLHGGDGEPIDYARLDAEALGSAYEGLLGHVVRLAAGPESAGRTDELAGAITRKGTKLIQAGCWYLAPTEGRRRAGAHYTSGRLTEDLVRRTLAPLLGNLPAPERILDLRVCDPAMGSGAFLVEVCRQLAAALSAAWERLGSAEPAFAREMIAATCLYGLDRDPIAVALAKLSLWLASESDTGAFDFVDHGLRVGDALLGLSREELLTGRLGWQPTAPETGQLELCRATSEPRGTATDDRWRDAADLALARWLGGAETLERRRKCAETMARLPELLGAGLGRAESREVRAMREERRTFHWQLELESIFAPGRGGFDAVVGNPPWVAYAGRAAQPLAPELRDWYLETSRAFARYRTLHGLFVDRAATLLRPRGRLGLVLPTSMADLGGYEPVRRAHAALCVPDTDLPDYGDGAFSGVFQPCMGLISTRCGASASPRSTSVWPLARSDLGARARQLLGALDARAKLPPHLFGERGYQTQGNDVAQIREAEAPSRSFSTPLRTGTEVEPFRSRPPRLFCDRRTLSGRFRADDEWRRVDLLIRQTARFPLAAYGDGLPFRNSILAGFGAGEHGRELLVAWINSSPVRWFHYHKQRDARQGMPQVKIGHLRDLPAPPGGSRVTRDLADLGHQLGERNGGVTAEEQLLVDELASEALGLAREEFELVQTWAAKTRG
jgi:hypothetical protein